MATTYHTPYAHGERTLPQKVCVGLGVLFLFVGILGFVAPAFLGMHLSFAHNIIHVVSGVLAVWVGLAANPMSAFRFAVWFGAFYGLLGIAGFVIGNPGYPSMGNLESDRFLMRIVPGVLEFGTNDHLVHILLGAAFLGTAISWKSTVHRKDTNTTLFKNPDQSATERADWNKVNVDPNADDVNQPRV